MANRELLTQGEVAKRLGVETDAVRELDHWRLSPVETARGLRYRREEVEQLLTRSGVARRLGKSIAAVRAIEGKLLYPSEGPGGVRLFDAEEVERLVGKPLGAHAQSRWLHGRSIARTIPVRPVLVRSLPQQTVNGRGIEWMRRQLAMLSDENADLKTLLGALAVELDQ